MTSPESWQKPEQQSLSQVVQVESVNLSQSVQAYFQPLPERSEIRQGLPLALDLGSMADLYGTDAYTGKTELKKEPAIMSDEIEQKPESAKQLRASEVIKTEGNFTTQGKQGDWDKATEAYRTTKYQSATHEILTDAQIAEMQAKGQGEKFEITGLTDNKSHQGRRVLIAQAIADGSKGEPQEQPQEQGLGADGRWHFQNPRVKPGQDIAGAIKEWIWNDAKNLPNEVAQTISDTPGNIAKTTINTGWNAAVGFGEAVNRNFGTNTIPEGAAMDYLSGIVKNPEKYDQPFREINPSACSAAYHAFGLDKLGIDPNLIAGLIWNEQLHLKPVIDDLQNAEAALNLPLKPDKSIGPAQIQVKNIQRLAEEYPALKQFGDPIKAALDPKAAPFFVAAYLASEAKAIGDYNHQHPGAKPIPVNTDTLAYRYNSDVYRDQQGNLRSLEPWEKVADRAKLLHGVRKEEFPIAGVLENSHHLRKVRQAMAEVAKEGK
jgi:hypothetical protein